MFYSVKHNQLRIQKISNIVKFYNIKQHRKLYILVQYSEELKKKGDRTLTERELE